MMEWNFNLFSVFFIHAHSETFLNLSWTKFIFKYDVFFLLLLIGNLFCQMKHKKLRLCKF